MSAGARPDPLDWTYSVFAGSRHATVTWTPGVPPGGAEVEPIPVGEPLEEVKAATPVPITKEDLNALLKKLALNPKIGREKAIKLLQEHSDGKANLTDTDPALYPAIQAAAEEALKNVD